MHLHPLNLAPYAGTEKQPGDLVIHAHGAFRVQPDGSWEALGPKPARKPAIGHNADGWPKGWLWAACGAALGLLIVAGIGGWLITAGMLVGFVVGAMYFGGWMA